jgi:hypothetical protein
MSATPVVIACALMACTHFNFFVLSITTSLHRLPISSVIFIFRRPAAMFDSSLRVLRSTRTILDRSNKPSVTALLTSSFPRNGHGRFLYPA